MKTGQNAMHMGKQLHCLKRQLSASPHGEVLGTIPKTAFVYDVLFANQHQLPGPWQTYPSMISVGTDFDFEYFSRKLHMKEPGMHRAELGKGAGFVCQDFEAKVFWHYCGQGEPQSNVWVHLLFSM